MANTLTAQMVALSRQIYKEWYPKTVLVQSCDNSFEGELNLKTKELDIPVYHDLSVHKTTLKERELKPAPIEFIRSSTKRVTIDKGRYSHFGELEIAKLVDNLSQENDQTRQKLANKWAQEAEEELGIFCAKLPSSQVIDLITLLTDATTNVNGHLNKDTAFKALDILKAYAESNNMSVSDFKLFVSSKFENVLRDSKMLLGSNLDANEAFRTGFVAIADGVDVRKIEINKLVARNASSKVVEAEWGIWKTRDGIQYVIPYKNTISYKIDPDEVLGGGTGYQIIEYYDFFNLYPSRLYAVKIRYAGTVAVPTV